MSKGWDFDPDPLPLATEVRGLDAFGDEAAKAARDGFACITVDPTLIAARSPYTSLHESFEFAKAIAYAEPVRSGPEPADLTRSST